MGRRHTGRKLAMQVLYQAQLRGGRLEESLEDYVEKGAFHEDTKQWASILSLGAWKFRVTADKLIAEYAIGWSLDRINPVDLSLLRLAFFELIEEKTPPTVVIDEVLELSKKYSTDDSSKFINGILGSYVEKHFHVHGTD